MELTFTAPLWMHEGGSWYFVSVPVDESDDLRDEFAGRTGGFGCIKVEVRIGATTWSTSVFPAKTGEYVLPVKQQVRRAQSLSEGDSATVHLRTLL